jgi:hypothetical protein
VGGPDLALDKMKARIQSVGGDPNKLYDPQRVFDEAIRRLCRSNQPTLKEVAGLRAFIYECLIRNVRWIECIHHIMLSVLKLEISDEYRLAALRILAKQEGTASGQTIPSYRIPMAWESLFLQIREALSGALPEEDDTSADSGTSHKSNLAETKKPATGPVDKRSTKRGGSTVAKTRGTGRK